MLLCHDSLFYQIRNQLLHAIFDTFNSWYIFVGKVWKFFCIEDITVRFVVNTSRMNHFLEKVMRNTSVRSAWVR